MFYYVMHLSNKRKDLVYQRKPPELSHQPLIYKEK